MDIGYSSQAVKQIKALDKATKERIKNGIDGLTVKPPLGDIKPMQGYSDGQQRLRIGG